MIKRTTMNYAYANMLELQIEAIGPANCCLIETTCCIYFVCDLRRMTIKEKMCVSIRTRLIIGVAIHIITINGIWAARFPCFHYPCKGK